MYMVIVGLSLSLLIGRGSSMDDFIQEALPWFRTRIDRQNARGWVSLVRVCGGERG